MQKVYKALADPTRRKILQLLRRQSMTAGEIAAEFESSWPTISRHLSVLRAADLVQSERDGASIIYRLNISVLEEVMLGMLHAFNIEVGDHDERESD